MKLLEPTKESRKAKRYLKRLAALKVFWVVAGFLVILVLSPLILFLFLRPKPPTHLNYGVTFSNKYAMELGLDWRHTYSEILDDLGAKNLRLIAYWDQIEGHQDEYDFSDIKWQLDEAEKRNLSVIMTIGRKVPRYPECHEPTWWRNIKNKNIKDQELYEYIKVAVSELKSYKSIKMWQVENEPFFVFGECDPETDFETVSREVEIVKELDDRPILIQDSGEGGFWFPSYKIGDYLAISMYRRIWYDFWGIFFGRYIYFEYPLAHWTYKIKAELARVPYQRIIVTELQTEPWGPGINSSISQEDKDKTMSRHLFLETLTYAQKAGFKDLYLWGVEWWLWEKEQNNNPFFWNASKALFN
ncbi:hypothetical protein ACFL13_01570 [Patescibacteria group bacterium]